MLKLKCLFITEIYAKVAQNSVVQARPAVIHFGGFELNKTQEVKLELANISGDVQRMHIIPPQTKYFYIKYKKNVSTTKNLFKLCSLPLWKSIRVQEKIWYDILLT